MNLFLNSQRRNPLLAALGLAVVLGLTGAAASKAPGTGTPAPEVKVDARPLTSTNSPLGQSYAPIVKRVAPSVVTVTVTEKARIGRLTGSQLGLPPGLDQFFGGQRFEIPEQQGQGSGVIATADGYILTNNHVVQDADVIEIGLSDGRKFQARVVGTDPATDLAVVKVDATGLPAIVFADSDRVEVGDRVLALGNPFGIGQTVTGGMVSGLGRELAGGRANNTGIEYQDFIQTDAAINPGNSGGALVDAEGRLIGINTAIVSGSGGSQGVGFAIPTNLAQGVMRQLVTTGKVVRGRIGVASDVLTLALAKEFKVPDTKGAFVQMVERDSPAERAGVQPGDVITGFNGRKIADTRQLRLTVASTAPETNAKIEILRDGKPQTLDITVAERTTETGNAAPGTPRSFGRRNAPARQSDGALEGVTVTDITRNARSEYGIPAEIRGALVVDVAPGTGAAKAGLTPGDVILEINREPVTSAEAAEVIASKPDPDRTTLIRVWEQETRSARFQVVEETE